MQAIAPTYTKKRTDHIEATTANAQALVADILATPARTVFGVRTYNVYNAAGQGVRFEVSTNRFITFLDETIATR